MGRFGAQESGRPNNVMLSSAWHRLVKAYCVAAAACNIMQDLIYKMLMGAYLLILITVGTGGIWQDLV